MAGDVISTAPVAAPLSSPPQHADGARQSFIDRLTSPGGLFLSAVIIATAFPVTNAIRDPDFWWHLRSGQLILQTGGLLHTDPFTYTVSTHAWTMHEWLTEVLFAELYRWAGLAAIVAVLSVVTWLGVLCIFMRARLDRPGPFALGGGMVLAVIAGYPIWGPRAQMITFALACLTLLLTERYLRRGGRVALLLLPLFLVWSNLHSGFIIGLGFMTVVLVAEGAAHLLHLQGRAPDRARARPGPPAGGVPGRLGDQPQRSVDHPLPVRDAGFGGAAVAHPRVAFTGLPRLVGALLRPDAAQPGGADRGQSQHPAARCRAGAGHGGAVTAVGAAHRPLRRGVDAGVDQPGRHAGGAAANASAPPAGAAAGADPRGQLGAALRSPPGRLPRRQVAAVDAHP